MFYSHCKADSTDWFIGILAPWKLSLHFWFFHKHFMIWYRLFLKDGRDEGMSSDLNLMRRRQNLMQLSGFLLFAELLDHLGIHLYLTLVSCFPSIFCFRWFNFDLIFLMEDVVFEFYRKLLFYCFWCYIFLNGRSRSKYFQHRAWWKGIFWDQR